jgi:protoporphyrinogen oxidase
MDTIYDSQGVIIIGGGIAGLTCAKYLNDQGKRFLLLEAADGLGGRVRTDVVEGYRLDRGFQVLLTNYSEAKKVLHYEDLDLKIFDSGAMIRMNDKFVTMANPFKKPSAVFATAFAPIGSWGDKLKILKFVQTLSNLSDDAVFKQDATDTLSFIKKYGWSNQIIDRFFRPFFGGVFLENELRTSSNFFEFVFKQFFKGDVAIPAMGMQAIPNQIEEMLPAKCIRKNTAVKGVEGNSVYLENGEVLYGEKIVLATDAVSADRFLMQNSNQKFNTTTCTYFGGEYAPSKAKMLMLNSDRKAEAQNVVVMSNIVPNAAPKGRSLIVVNTSGLDKYDEKTHLFRVKRDLLVWFGSQVNVWRHLKTYHLPEALPSYTATSEQRRLKLTERLYRCGDYLAYPSINAAMQTGREVAQSIIE